MATTDPPAKHTRSVSALEQLQEYTTVVADTGEFSTLKDYAPQDATTNPSLLLKAASLDEYSPLVDDAVRHAKSSGLTGQEQLDLAMDKLAVNFGLEILKIVPGYVSTEVDARLSFDVEQNLKRARRIISLYEEAGVPRDRILIKLASTWEGFKTCEILEKEGIHCNMTLLFSFCQAQVAAEVGATLISPFVGRILDWYKASTGRDSYPAEEDPGVLSVTRIFNYFKTHGFKTIVMGASFRNIGEIMALAGCDRLTISPKLLSELKDSTLPVTRALHADTKSDDPLAVLSEAEFRFALNEDAMATEKLAQGIRGFSADLRKLEDKVRKMLAE